MQLGGSRSFCERIFRLRGGLKKGNFLGDQVSENYHNNHAIDSDLYKVKRKDHKTGKFFNISIPDMIKNLKEMLMPLPEAVSFQRANMNDIVRKLETLHNEIKQNYRHREAAYISLATGAVINNKVTSEHSVINNDQDVTFMETVTYVAAFFVDEQRDWYPGILTKVVRSKVCGTCISIKHKNKTYKEHENLLPHKISRTH